MSPRRQHRRPRRPKRKRCEETGKFGYKSREDVVMAAAFFSRQERFHGQSFYVCIHCGLWHATSA